MRGAFIEVENEGWPTIALYKNNRGWNADMELDGKHAHVEGGDDPEEVVAELERLLVQELAQGGQLTERRSSRGRRAYDGRDSSIQRSDRLDDRRHPGQFGMRP